MDQPERRDTIKVTKKEDTRKPHKETSPTEDDQRDVLVKKKSPPREHLPGKRLPIEDESKNEAAKKGHLRKRRLAEKNQPRN